MYFPCRAYYNLGYLYQDIGAFAKSIECFKKAALLEPLDVDTHINLGLVLKQHGRIREAIEAYRHAINCDSNCIMAYFNLGNTYQDIKNYQAAIECFQQVLRIDPRHTDALFNLAISYHDYAMSSETNINVRIDKLNQAMTCYNKVYAVMPELEEALRAAKNIEKIITNSLSLP